MPRLLIIPHFDGPDRGDGGIRRVVEAQRRHLPGMGWELVDRVEDADVVATHAGNLVDVPATKPLVSHCHGLYWYGYEWERWALKMNRDVIKSIRRSDAVTAPSEWVAHTIRRGTQIDPVVLYHGVDLEEFEPVEGGADSQYVLWNKTRIDPICDPRPYQELAKRASGTHFVTTIAWPYETSPANLEVAGVLAADAARNWVRHCAVYVSTARETFGIGILEAMAYGRPVLAWNHGAAREIITHLENGYLCDPNDIEDQLTGLNWCMQHRVPAGRAARAAVAERFTWPLAISRYDDLYRALLDAARESRPRVSVVIPAYNMQDYLDAAVASATLQADVEVVIVDDASTDETPGVADIWHQEMPDTVRVIHNMQNLYLAEALNVGISAAKGHYILPLDADNMLGLGSVALLADALDKDRDVDIAYGSMSVIEEDGTEWTSTWPGQFDFRRQLIHQNQIPSTSMYRRRVWERVGGYRRRCRTAEDADFWCRATSFGASPKKITDAVVLRYRNRSDSMSHTVEDWPWHEWYPWNHDTALTPWIAPVDSERDDPVIPAYETPLVSVVIPVGLGHERLVLDALDSLNAQTFRWWEAIVVNDTGAEIPWLPAWCHVVTSSHRGAGAARNAGMRVARGKTFTFLDADDWLQPHALEFMVATWIKAKGGFVYTDWFKGETGEIYRAPEWDGCESVLHQLPWSVTCLYGHDVWDIVGPFDESLPAWEDWDFAIRVVKAGFCGTRVAVPLFHYRITSGARREAGFADRENLKNEILARHRALIEGEEPMPCGCQGGGGLPSLPALDLSSHNTGIATVAPRVDGASPDQMVLVEFTDPDVRNPLVFTGRVTGTRYPFGSDDDNRVRWVYKTDADHLLLREEFRLYAQVDDGTRLMAAGPPR